MRLQPVSIILSALLAAVASVAAQAATTPNTTVTGAVSYEVGQGWVSHYISEGTQNRWFKFTTTGGRGYCLEAAQGSDSQVAFNPNLTVYTDVNGTTVLGSNDNGSYEPAMTLGSRYCFVDTAALDTRTVRTVKLNVPVTASSGDDGYARLRIYDTTMAGSYSWALNYFSSDPAANSVQGLIHFENYGASAVTVYYQARSSCTNHSSTDYCTPASRSGSISVPARGGADIWDYNMGYTTGTARFIMGVAAPLGEVRAYAVTGTTSTTVTSNAAARIAPPTTPPTIDTIKTFVSIN